MNSGHFESRSSLSQKQQGPIAQLGARLNGIEKAEGSNPSGSTKTGQVFDLPEFFGTDRDIIFLKFFRSSRLSRQRAGKARWKPDAVPAGARLNRTRLTPIKGSCSGEIK